MESQEIVLVLPFIAILISSLSALYARWAWSEAKKANKLGLHSYQKDIFIGFTILKSHMDQRGYLAELEEVEKFNDLSKLVKLYFKNTIVEELNSYYALCEDIAIHNRPPVSAKNLLSLTKKANDATELAMKIEAKIIALISVG